MASYTKSTWTDNAIGNGGAVESRACAGYCTYGSGRAYNTMC